MSEFAEWMDLLARAEGVADYGPIYRLDVRVEELLEGLGAAAREEGLLSGSVGSGVSPCLSFGRGSSPISTAGLYSTRRAAR